MRPAPVWRRVAHQTRPVPAEVPLLRLVAFAAPDALPIAANRRQLDEAQAARADAAAAVIGAASRAAQEQARRTVRVRLARRGLRLAAAFEAHEAAANGLPFDRPAAHAWRLAITAAARALLAR